MVAAPFRDRPAGLRASIELPLREEPCVVRNIGTTPCDEGLACLSQEATVPPTSE